jgi:hypothetical protein
VTRTDADKVSAAQELVDRLHAMAGNLDYNAERLDPSANVLVLRARANAFRQAAHMLDELL